MMLAATLFLLIPLTQMFDQPEKPDLAVREIRISPPPPPDAPPPPEETPPDQPETAPEEIPEAPPPVDLQPLDVDLTAGSSEAIQMGARLPSFQMETDSVSDIEELFTFDDLSESPRLLNTPRFRYPSSLVRRGIEKGRVIVEIDILPDGSARLRRIVSSTEPELEPIARRIVKQAQFTSPEIDGQPQTVRGRFPLRLEN